MMSNLSREAQAVCEGISHMRKFTPIVLSIVEVLIAAGISPEIIAQHCNTVADMIRTAVVDSEHTGDVAIVSQE